jgi:hypothetical protein
MEMIVTSPPYKKQYFHRMRMRVATDASFRRNTVKARKKRAI